MKFFIGFLIFFFSQFANAVNFKFSADNPSYKKIKFSNNDTLIIEQKDIDSTFGQKLNYAKKSSINAQIINIEDDILSFIYAYPSVNNAQISILLSTCAGSACIPNIYVAYVEDHQLIMHELGATLYNHNLNFEISVVNNRVSLSVNNVNTFKENAYGDAILTKMTLLNKVGFIDTSFNNKFIKFLNTHPETFFSDINFRQKLARKIGLAKFKELRESMMVASNTYIVNGHYITMAGCMPHSCGSNEGIILLDTSTENYYAVLINNDINKIETFSTSAFSQDSINILKEVMFKNGFDVEFNNKRFKFKN